MPSYTTLAAVKARLIGKVQFTTDASQQNKMQESLALELIAEAESQVEFDLSPRYESPLQGDNGAYDGVSTTAKNIITNLSNLMSVIRILETDFGTGSAVNGDKYKTGIETRYKQIVTQLLEKKKDGGTESQGWKYPPLPGLKLMYGNAEADDGYMGLVIVANGSSSHGYAAKQVNDPAMALWGYWGEE